MEAMEVSTVSILELPDELLALIFALFSRAFKVDALWQHKCEEDKALTWKSVDVTWRDLYTLDLSDLCPHLNRLDRYQLPWVLLKVDEYLARRQTITCHGTRCPFTINNLWMCVEPGCGFVGCGRRDNVHMMNHIEEKKHHLTLKLVSLEMYCYTCQWWIGGPTRHPVEQSRYRELREILSRSTGKHFDQSLVDRRIKERTLPAPRNTQRFWALLPMAWEKKWERFIIGDDDGFKDPIVTSSLLGVDGKLRLGLSSGMDYQICSILAWKYFASTYGGGPAVLWDWFDHLFVVAPTNLEQIYAEEEIAQAKFDEAQKKRTKPKKFSLKPSESKEGEGGLLFDEDDEADDYSEEEADEGDEDDASADDMVDDE